MWLAYNIASRLTLVAGGAILAFVAGIVYFAFRSEPNDIV